MFVTAPTPAFISAAEAQVAAVHPAESTDYNKLMSLWQNAPDYASGLQNTPTAGDECDSLVLPGWATGSLTPCSQTYITVSQSAGPGNTFCRSVWTRS